MVTLPRQLMFKLNLLPGDFVEIESLPDGSARIRPWETRDNATRQSPGVIPDKPEALKV